MTAAPTSSSNEIVLVVEDSPPNRQILAHTLQKLGFKVIECKNGQEAWQLLDKNQSGKVIAIFTDIMMPQMSGLDLLKKIRADGRFKTIPAVILSAVNDKDQVIEARELGVLGYLIKPLHFDGIVELIGRVFPDRKLAVYNLPKY